MHDQFPKLVRDAIEIWRAGVAAVDSARLVSSAVRVSPTSLSLGPHQFDLESIRRIVVVGAGKAGAGMARGLLKALGDELSVRKNLVGWVNVPDDCVGELPRIRLYGARPPGENLPTARVQSGTEKILDLVRQCSADDLCICLLSGGGSALLDLPLPSISLADQVATTAFLSASQANIQQLNTVRKQISEVKGGRLAAACRAPLVSLIISDVLGDPLDVIASGPTVADSSTRHDALAILKRFDPEETNIPISIRKVLRHSDRPAVRNSELAHVANVIVGNLRVAVDAANARARELGYQAGGKIAETLEGPADDIGRDLVQSLRRLETQSGSSAWIEGGEPVVRLVDPSKRGIGGRNQQVILAFADALPRQDWKPTKRFCALSGGTDGEDGPTDAAGAWLDDTTFSDISRLGLDSGRYLAHNDAYHFFAQLGTLLKTGPTNTNVGDLRILLSN